MQEPKELEITQLDIEVYDWKTGDYIADFSHILTNGLRVTWKLNDVDEFDFGLDYEQFKLKCEEMGVSAEKVLSPGIHDVRVRYNGKYIIGGYVAQTEININRESNPTLQVRCLGFLNLFKGRLTNAQYSHKTYSQIARSLVQDCQKRQPINKTSVPAINTNGWVFAYGFKGNTSGAVYRSDINRMAFNVVPLSNRWASLAVRVDIPSGTKVDVSWRQLTPAGYTQAKLVERSQPAVSADQVSLITLPTSDFNGTWKTYEVKNYPLYHQTSWLLLEGNTGNGANFFVTDFEIKYSFDEDALHNLKSTLGVDTASPLQKNHRRRGYELQDVKEAIVNLTKLENDNFDFSFTPQRQFNTFSKKGSEKTDIVISYPYNLDSGTITRDISDMTNYSYAIGSGIGDQKLEAITHDKESRRKYGTIVRTKTFNDVKLSNTLYQHSIGEVNRGKLPTDIPSLTVSDGTMNPGVIETGDIITVQMENDPYLETVTDKYRITGMSWNIDNNMGETMTLTLTRAKEQDRKPIMVRYIKEILDGSNKTANNHWVQIQAIEMQGDKEINRALNKPATSYPAGLANPQRITNGNLNSNDFANLDGQRVAVTIDLGQAYPIDYIRVWHYYADGRYYYNHGLSVGLENKPGFENLEYVLWNGFPYPEKAIGRKSGWVQLEGM